MRNLLIALTVLAAPVSAQDKPAPSPPEIVAAAPKEDWAVIAASDLLVMDLAADAKGKPRRVVIQLMPAPFSQGWIGNIRKLAAAQWWDGLSINRVQDNYVVQWGDADGEDAKKAKSLPVGLVTVPESEYSLKRINEMRVYDNDASGFTMVPEIDAEKSADPYASSSGYLEGFPVAASRPQAPFMWPVHCYGMVGVGRDMPPDTGSGAELYAVIGHAPRHLDRNIALVGRVIEGIEHLSSLPRGTGPLGFYASAEERTGIVSVRLASDLPSDKPFPAYEYLSTESASFAAYAEARANRRDPFFIHPAGGADICNIPVPVRRSTGSR